MEEQNLARVLTVDMVSLRGGAGNERDTGGAARQRRGHENPGASDDSRGRGGGDSGGELRTRAPPKPGGSESVREDGRGRAGGSRSGCAVDIGRILSGGCASEIPKDGGAGRGRRASGVAWLALWVCMGAAMIQRGGAECIAEEEIKGKCEGGCGDGDTTCEKHDTSSSSECLAHCCAQSGCVAYVIKGNDCKVYTACTFEDDNSHNYGKVTGAGASSHPAPFPIELL